MPRTSVTRHLCIGPSYVILEPARHQSQASSSNEAIDPLDLRTALVEIPFAFASPSWILAVSTCFGLGALSKSSVLVASGYVEPEDIDRLASCGAVGDILRRFIND